MGFRKAFLGFSTRCLSVFGHSMVVTPTGMQYGYYLPPNRYTWDQVPCQNNYACNAYCGCKRCSIFESVYPARVDGFARFISNPYENL